MYLKLMQNVIAHDDWQYIINTVFYIAFDE